MAMGRPGPKIHWTSGVSAKEPKPIKIDWPRYEAACNVTFSTEACAEIEDLLKWRGQCLVDATAAWPYKDVREAAQEIEKAIEKFRKQVIDGEVFPKHPDGPGAAQLQFASRARQAVGYLAMLEAVYLRGDAGPDTGDYNRDGATDSRIEELDRQAVKHLRMLSFQPDDFQLALDKTTQALRALHGSITPLIELGALSRERSDPEDEIYRAFLQNLRVIFRRHDLPAGISSDYPERSLFLRFLVALKLEEELDPATARRIYRYLKRKGT